MIEEVYAKMQAKKIVYGVPVILLISLAYRAKASGIVFLVC